MVHQTTVILHIHTGEDVVFVCNDWHTGPLSCYLKSNYQSNGIYRDAKVSFLNNVVFVSMFVYPT